MNSLHKTRSTLALTLLGAAALLFAPQPAEAGIVVLETGKVIVGKVDKNKDVTDEDITVRWPYKDYRQPEAGEDEKNRGEMVIPRHLIRWFDADMDELPDSYYEKYEKLKLGDDWMAHREKWRIRQKNKIMEVEGEIPDLRETGLGEGPTTKPAEEPKEPPPAAEASPATPAPQPKGGCMPACSLDDAQGSGAPAGVWLMLVLGGLGWLRWRSSARS